MNRRSLVISFTLCCFAAAADAGPLSIVHVNAPAVNTVFDPSGIVLVQDSVSTFAIAGGAGEARLQSRTSLGQPGAQAAGQYVYSYRLNLTNVTGIVNIPCVSSLTLNFGAITALDYGEDGGASQHVFVVTSGGLGTVAPTSAERNGNSITFHFGSLICAGGSPGTGESSYFFGLTSPRSPAYVTATVQDSDGPTYLPQARAARVFIFQISSAWHGVFVLQTADGRSTEVDLVIDEADHRRFRGTMTLKDPRSEQASAFDVEGTMAASGEFTLAGEGPDGRLLAHGKGSPLGEGASLDGRVRLTLGGQKTDGTLRLVQSIGTTEPPRAIREWDDRQTPR